MPEIDTSLVARYALAPAEIEATSLRHVAEALHGLERWSAEQRPIVQRMVYAAGDLTLASSIRIHPRAVGDGVAALRAGCPMLVDVRMVSAAVDRARLTSLGGGLVCVMDYGEGSATDEATHPPDACSSTIGRSVSDRGPEAPALGPSRNLPRAVIGMRAIAHELRGGVAVVGTAPTALLALLDLVDGGTVTPALIIGTPVGFTAAAESKAELMARGVPYITVEGTRGGAALAAAAANALLRLAVGEPTDLLPGAARG